MTAAKLEDVKTPAEFDAIVAAAPAVVVHFWATWCEPCGHMDRVLEALAGDCSPTARFLRVEAEEVDDLAERYDVSAVPHFLIFKDGKVAAAVEGADAPALTTAVTTHLGDAGTGPSTRAAGAAVAAAVTGTLAGPCPARLQAGAALSSGGGVNGNGGGGVGGGGGGGGGATGSGAPGDGGLDPALRQRLQQLINSSPVMLFMKGSPDAPRCGFSSQVVAALRQVGCSFGHFDILGDPNVRAGLKEYSDWPTYPQLYAGGELVGGADIVLEMAGDGELEQALDDATAAAPQSSPAAATSPTTPSASQPAGSAATAAGDSGKTGDDGGKDVLQQRLRALTTQAHVMLFIKGSRQQPFCRFSKAAVAALNETGAPYDTFDVFTDDEVREGLKEYADWPTYPQLFVGGELVGGADIIAELASTKELAEAVGVA
eukprot:CAMPEP_0206152000 /NCGR_PEP_ID=MMETSP1473-20131121/39106_1 /ASSEMBLY_ACC=CAM_ASM_001109 /TAXON_ID=1461547 /ORGANISM="Stichococcus sp, Strain RCC1054" /LENGTH=429 /DNA_ID=CAMNT_0053549553 /DNA_START=152 /DNA_END=1442 /DNA_ORIENTATION=-